jgi:hypothetical protein
VRLTTAAKYAANVAARVREQQGWLEASRVSSQLLRGEFRKRLNTSAVTRPDGTRSAEFLQGENTDVSALLLQARKHGLDFLPMKVDRGELLHHAKTFSYPRFYAGGSVDYGGAREKKILEYFVALKLATVTSDDVVIDVASEYSIFPDLVRKQSGAIVFRQDLIYRSGVHGDRIGGNAAAMPVPREFASKLTLHNSFEHFEGGADTEFIEEAWRVLRGSGMVIIVPLYLSIEHANITDPFVEHEGLEFDANGHVYPVPGYRNRFGRFYSISSLTERVLEPARSCGFDLTLYHFSNIRDLEPTSGLHFGLVLAKD